MWRRLRIALLLFVLATVAQGAWLARTRVAEWKTSLRVVIYPTAGDGSETATRYVAELRRESFEPIESFFSREAARHGLALGDPVNVFLAPPLAAPPPQPPFGASRPAVMLWSLRLRYFAWRYDTHRGPRPDVRVFVSYFDPAAREVLPHSTGLEKGMLGVVNAFATTAMEGSNHVVIAHELMHTFGATDKYDAAAQPVFPHGYAEPDARPLYPQRLAEIMGGRVPISESRSEIPRSLRQSVIGPRTAREINWLK
jgi:hypothetical protein